MSQLWDAFSNDKIAPPSVLTAYHIGRDSSVSLSWLSWGLFKDRDTLLIFVASITQ